MISVLSLLFLLLPVAAASGWIAARRHYKPVKDPIPKEYFIGLDFLLNEQPDKAVEIFIKMLEVNSETVETHLTLGSLFRRQGQVDRAIRIHQNLIARPNLGKQQKIQALSALAKDYLSAGVLDRSEHLCLDVLALDPQQSECLYQLLDIYQTEKSWEQAIEIAKRIASHKGKNMNGALAHYHCELAEEALSKHDTAGARQFLKKAIHIDPDCIRANFIQARLEASQQAYSSAIKLLQQVHSQMPDYFSETLPLLNEYAQCNHSNAELIQYFKKILPECPRISIATIITKQLLNTQSKEEALNFLTQYLSQQPSIRGVHFLIALVLPDAAWPLRNKLEILQHLFEKILSTQPNYLCHNCGFSGKTLLWLCPGCKQWNSIKPILGLNGE